MTDLETERAQRLARRQKAIDRTNGQMVSCRVTKRGDGKLATGEYDSVENTHTHFARGDVVRLPKHVAAEQEDAGYVEIIEDEKRGPGRPPQQAAA